MATVQRTSVEVLRRELKLRFQNELLNGVQGPSDILEELVVDPVEESRFPLFFQKMLGHGKNEKTKAVPAGRRVPSRSEGAALPDILSFNQHSHDDSLPCPSFPPHTIRGVTNSKETETQIFQVRPSTSPAPSTRKIMGGYDGGFEAGFMGTWNKVRFDDLIQSLEIAKQAAYQESECLSSSGQTDEKYVSVSGRLFRVHPTSCRYGATYKYLLEGDGMKVYIHSNPKGSIQGVRVRYGHESLCGRDVFAVHAQFLDWLKELGFTVTDETVSRADFQTMFARPVSDFTDLIFGGCCVKRAKKSNVHFEGDDIEGYKCGSSIMLRIYDKRKELLDKPDEVKMSLVINDCLGGELPDDLTRVEFQLRRDALKYLGVKTVQDLLERENAIVDFLTYDWFRLLRDKKVADNTSKQAISSLWEEVRAAFFEYFPGSVENRKPIDKNIPGRRSVKCTADALLQQAVGCLATACSLVKGVVENEAQALAFVMEKVGDKASKLFRRVYERTVELGIVRGVDAPNALDWEKDPRFAMSGDESGFVPEMPPDFRVVFDEDLQYDNFRKVAVAGCPF